MNRLRSWQQESFVVWCFFLFFPPKMLPCGQQALRVAGQIRCLSHPLCTGLELSPAPLPLPGARAHPPRPTELLTDLVIPLTHPEARFARFTQARVAEARNERTCGGGGVDIVQCE